MKTQATVFANFRQYGLPLPEIVRADAARLFDCFRGVGAAFDAVVADPPYGLRAGARCSGSAHEAKPVPAHHRAEHVPATKPSAAGVEIILTPRFDGTHSSTGEVSDRYRVEGLRRVEGVHSTRRRTSRGRNTRSHAPRYPVADVLADDGFCDGFLAANSAALAASLGVATAALDALGLPFVFRGVPQRRPPRRHVPRRAPRRPQRGRPPSPSPSWRPPSPWPSGSRGRGACHR